MTPPQSAPRGEMFPKRPGTAQQELQPPTAPSHPAGASLGNVKTAGLPGDSSDTHPTREAEGGGGGVRALPTGPYPALPTAQHSPTPPCTHRNVTVTRTDPEPSNRATAASPHCPPPRPPQCATRSQHSPVHPLSCSAPQTHPEQQTPLPAPHTSSLLGCEVPRSPHGDPHTGLPARPSPPALCCAEPCRWQSQADTNIIPSCGPG